MAVDPCPFVSPDLCSLEIFCQVFIVIMTGWLTLDLQQDSVAGQADPQVPVRPGGEEELVGAAVPAHHAATPLAVMAPDQQPAQGHKGHMSHRHRGLTHPNSMWQLMQAATVLLGSITGANSLQAALPDLSSSLAVH